MLYLTIDDSGILGTNGAPNLYTSLNVILWADPNNDGGTVTSTVENDAMFSGNTANGTFTEPNGTSVNTAMGGESENHAEWA